MHLHCCALLSCMLFPTRNAHCFAKCCMGGCLRYCGSSCGLTALPHIMLGSQQLSLKSLLLWQRKIALGMHAPATASKERALVFQQRRRGRNVVQVQAACGQAQQSHVPYGSCSLIIRPRCLLGCVECAQPSARPHGRITYLCRPLAPWTLPHASAAQDDSGTAGKCWTGMVKQHSISP